MTSAPSPATSCAVVLAGGLGTRVRSIWPNLPKPMIPVAGGPFLEWVLRYLTGQGIPNFLISLGYRAEVAEDYFRTRPAGRNSIKTIRENEPLGTGGALLMAESLMEKCDPAVLANGDSLVLADLTGAWRLLSETSADGVVVGIEVDDAARYGRLEIDAAGRLSRFDEKQPGAAVINAGIYLFRRRLLRRFPRTTPLSIERDVFPALLAGGARLMVHRCRAPFLDIGTPESLGQADDFIRQHFCQVAE